LTKEWRDSIIVPVYKKGNKTDCSNYRGISLLLVTYKILPSILLSRSTPHAEEITEDHHCGFYATGQLLIIHSAFIKYLGKKWQYNEAVHQLFVDRKTYNAFKRGVVYHIIIEFGIPMKLVGLINMCLNETYSRIWVGEHLSDVRTALFYFITQ
jgi:hypothetical protein